MKKITLTFSFIILYAILLTAQTVYITKTGSKYHRESCSYLRKSSIPISLQDAISKGYTPCSRCNPPTLNSNKTIKSAFPDNKSNRQVQSKSEVQESSNTVDSKGRTIYTGPRGGRYYINSKGNKVYIKNDKQSKSEVDETSTYSDSKGRTIYTGPRGGQYYYNSKGKKTYVRKKH